jgi:hypothetical protein
MCCFCLLFRGCRKFLTEPRHVAFQNHKKIAGGKKNLPVTVAAKGACNAMLFCGACGFVIAPTISLSPAVIDLNRQVLHHFIAGELSDYHGKDCNPPKS